MSTIRFILLTTALVAAVPVLAQAQSGFGTAPITFGTPAPAPTAPVPTATTPADSTPVNMAPTSSVAPAPTATPVAATPAPSTPDAATAASTPPADAPAATAPAASAPAASGAAQPSCPAGQINPAAKEAEKPGLPYTLQKLYALRLPEFMKYDLNCDGFLDAKEQKQLIDAKFAAHDTNKDGVIDATEAQAVVGNFEEQAANTPGLIVDHRANTLKNRLGIMDANQDGIITKAEFVAYYTDRFRKLDRNGDGKLDITEYQTDDEENRQVKGD